MVSSRLLLILVATVTPCVLSFPAFVDNIPNGKALGKELGHGAKGYTPFGELFKADNKSWPEMCSQTWPGQKEVTVGAALGDPCCKWKSGPPDVVLTAPNLSGTVCKDGVAVPKAGAVADTPTASPPILIAKAPLADTPTASPPILIARAPIAAPAVPAPLPNPVNNTKQTGSRPEVLCEAA